MSDQSEAADTYATNNCGGGGSGTAIKQRVTATAEALKHSNKVLVSS